MWAIWPNDQNNEFSFDHRFTYTKYYISVSIKFGCEPENTNCWVMISKITFMFNKTKINSQKKKVSDQEKKSQEEEKKWSRHRARSMHFAFHRKYKVANEKPITFRFQNYAQFNWKLEYKIIDHVHPCNALLKTAQRSYIHLICGWLAMQWVPNDHFPVLFHFFSSFGRFVFGCNLIVTSAWADGHQTCNHKLCIAFFTGQFKWFFENIISMFCFIFLFFFLRSNFGCFE